MSDLAPQDLLSQAAVLLDKLPLELIHGEGADRVSFLHRLLSGNVASTQAGTGCHALLLDTKGHVQSDLEIYVTENETWLVVAAGQAASTAMALSRYAIMDDFVATVSPERMALAVLGPKAAAALEAAHVALPADLVEAPLRRHQEVGAEENALWVIRDQRLGVGGYQVWGTRPQIEGLAERLRAAGVLDLDPSTAEALRIAAGEPRFGIDITPARFPMELGLDDAIDYSKGCYLGQEPIVRIRDRGHVNWGLRRLRLAPGAPVPAAGDRLESDARPEAGHVTSAATLPDPVGAQVVALALVHKSAFDGPVRVLTAQGPAPAEVLSLKPASLLDRGPRD